MTRRERSPEDELLAAIGTDDPAAVRRALRAAPNLDARYDDSTRFTALHAAADDHDLAAVELLLEAGADVDARDAYGNTPLHYAAFDRTTDDPVVRALLAAGADPAGVANRAPDAFDGESVIAAYDGRGVVLAQRPDGTLAAFRRPWMATYHPRSNDDWEHVFVEFPDSLLVPVKLAWLIGRLPTGSGGQPVQLAALRVDKLPEPFPAPGTSEYDDAGFDALGTVARLEVRSIVPAVSEGRIADPETVALLFAITHEVEHGLW